MGFLIANVGAIFYPTDQQRQNDFLLFFFLN